MEAHEPGWCPAWAWGWRTAIAVLASVLLAAGLAEPAVKHFRAWLHLTSGGFSGQSGVSSEARPVHNPLDYFSQRSPGGRSSRSLVQIKSRVKASPHRAVRPHERVLSNIRGGPGAAAQPIPAYLDELVPNFKPGLFEPKLPQLVPPPMIPPLPPASYPIIPFTIPPITPAVPEPATWLMQVLGFGLIGHRVRRRLPKGCDPTKMPKLCLNADKS